MIRGDLCYTVRAMNQIPVVGFAVGMIKDNCIFVIMWFYRIVGKMIKISCGFPAKASKRTQKYAWRRQETPDSGVIETLVISISLL